MCPNRPRQSRPRFCKIVAIASVAAATLAMASLNPVAIAAPVPAGGLPRPEVDPKPIPGEHVFQLAYSPNRKLLAVVDGNNSFDKLKQPVRSRLTLFDAATHAIVRQVSEPNDVPEPFRGVQFAPNGTFLYLRSFEGPVYTCDLPKGEVRKRLDPRSGHLFELTVSPDGKSFATGHLNSLADVRRRAIWDASSFKLIRDIKSDTELSIGGVFAPDGKAIAFGYDEKGVGGVMEIDPRSGAEIRRTPFTTRSAGAKTIASPSQYSPDGKWLVLCGGEGIPMGRSLHMKGYLRIWDRRTGAVRTLGDGRLDYYRTAAISADGKRLYGGTRGVAQRVDSLGTRWQAGEVHCWDTTTWKELWSTEMDGGEPQQIAETPSGRRLWVADEHGLWLLDADTGKGHGILIQTRKD